MDNNMSILTKILKEHQLKANQNPNQNKQKNTHTNTSTSHIITGRAWKGKTTPGI